MGKKDIVILPARHLPIMRLLMTSLLIASWLAAVGQPSSTRNWIDTEVTWTDSAGNAIRITNSLPKGGGRYTGAPGKTYSYVIFWTRIINESTNPAEIAINLPPVEWPIFPSPESHIRVFLPTETMTIEKIPQFDYGLTNLTSLLDSGFNRPSTLQRTINPKEDFLFYTAVLFHEARGSARAAFELKGKELLFRISVAPDVNSAKIYCGRLVFRN